MQALKRFGDYYFWKYNSREVQSLVKATIERYMLNRDLDMKDKIYLVNPNYLQSKISALMAIPGEIGFTVRMGLFTGLREEELYYIHDKEICCNELGCKCNNLHPINIDRNTGITIIGINWIRGNKKAFVTILPTKMWEQFRRTGSYEVTENSLPYYSTVYSPACSGTASGGVPIKCTITNQYHGKPAPPPPAPPNFIHQIQR